MDNNESAGPSKPVQQNQQPQPKNDGSYSVSKSSYKQKDDTVSSAHNEDDLPPHIDVVRQNAKIQSLYKELLEAPLPDSIESLIQQLKNKEGKE